MTPIPAKVLTLEKQSSQYRVLIQSELDRYLGSFHTLRFGESEKGVTNPNELMIALKRYLEQCGKTEQAVASQIGVNRHTLARWLCDKESPKKGKLALTAFFLRRAGYL
jgi:DNA-binding XRE family transcriptional regulator